MLDMRRYSSKWIIDFAEVKTGTGSYLMSFFKDTTVLNSVFKKCPLEDQSKNLILYSFPYQCQSMVSLHCVL